MLGRGWKVILQKKIENPQRQLVNYCFKCLFYPDPEKLIFFLHSLPLQADDNLIADKTTPSPGLDATSCCTLHRHRTPLSGRGNDEKRITKTIGTRPNTNSLREGTALKNQRHSERVLND